MHERIRKDRKNTDLSERDGSCENAKIEESATRRNKGEKVENKRF